MIEYEQAVLGACVLQRGAFPKVSDLLTESDFTTEFNIRVFRAVAKLHRDHQPIDMLSVGREIRDVEQGIFKLTELTGKVVSDANIEYHAYLLVQETIRREMGVIYASALARNEKDPSDAISYVEKEMSLHIARMGRKQAEEIRVVLDRTQNEVYERVQAVKEGRSPGIATGIVKIDRECGGVFPSDMVVIGGRPGMGKSGLMVAIAKGMAESGNKVGILSLEMTSDQLAERIASSYCGIPYSDIRRGHLNDVELSSFGDAVARAKKLDILLDDEADLSFIKYRSKIQRMVEAGCSAVMLDYLQLVGSEDEKDERIRSKRGSKMTKTMAKEFDVPIIGLAQLNRDAENNTDKRPMLKNFAESDQYAMDADTVWLLWRPEYYGISRYEINGVDSDTKNKLWLIQEKHRFGPRGFDYVLDCDIATNRIGEDGTMFKRQEPDWRTGDTPW